MPKKTTEDLLAEAGELEVEVDPEWDYSELLNAVKAARVDAPSENRASSSAAADEDALVEQPIDVTAIPASERILSAPGSSRRRFPFDSLGRYIGR